MAGLSVTTPHKFAVMEQLDWIEPTAREIGAVNTIVIAGDELRGFNTDAAALIKPLAQKLGDLRDDALRGHWRRRRGNCGPLGTGESRCDGDALCAEHRESERAR